jgi:hypothetical protein
MRRGSAIATSWLALSCAGCVQVPEPAVDPALVAEDGAVGRGLSTDGGWLRPPTGAPYAGPECAPAVPAAGGNVGSAPSTGGGSAPGIVPADAPLQDPRSPGATPGSTARAPAAAGELVISELMTNPEAVRDDAGEWFELHNPSADQALDLDGCTLQDGGAAARPLAGSLRIGPGGFAVIARSEQAGFTPDRIMSFSLANSADSLALACGGVEIDRVAYGAGFALVAGASLSLDPSAYDAVRNDAAAAWCAAQLSYGVDLGTPGASNPDCDAAAQDAGSD